MFHLYVFYLLYMFNPCFGIFYPCKIMLNPFLRPEDNEGSLFFPSGAGSSGRSSAVNQADLDLLTDIRNFVAFQVRLQQENREKKDAEKSLVSKCLTRKKIILI